MRPYETMVVLSTSLGAEMQALIERLHGVITTRGGTIDASHDWGQRRLAYQIEKQSDGHYFLIEYSAEPDAVSELERSLRITDGVLRYLTVQQEHTGLPKPRERETPRADTPLHEMRSPGSPPPRVGEAPAETARSVDAAAPAPQQQAAGAEAAVADAADAVAPTVGDDEPVSKPEAGKGDAADDVASAASDDGVNNDE